MTNYATKPQIQIIRTILSKQGLNDDKDAIIEEFTGGRTNSTSKLYFSEATTLIKQLKNPVAASEEKQRKHIIAMAHEMTWELEDGKADMKRINSWVAKYGHLNASHRTINDYKGTDLQTLVTQFQNVYKSYLKAIAKP